MPVVVPARLMVKSDFAMALQAALEVPWKRSLAERRLAVFTRQETLGCSLWMASPNPRTQTKIEMVSLLRRQTKKRLRANISEVGVASRSSVLRARQGFFVNKVIRPRKANF